ncbi:hypothetical protein [Neptuniibacter sp. QD37_11]|uniref:hypothetical protein n=1 Tax=Neptuniibacter sp. QD37_11 TaxID=3398209 RepID=UPI0039F458D5
MQRTYTEEQLKTLLLLGNQGTWGATCHRIYINDRKLCGIETTHDDDGKIISAKFQGDDISPTEAAHMLNGKLYHQTRKKEWKHPHMDPKVATLLIYGFEANNLLK